MCFLLVIVVLAMTEMSVAAVSFRNVIAKLYLHCFINTSHLSAGYPTQITDNTGFIEGTQLLCQNC